MKIVKSSLKFLFVACIVAGMCIPAFAASDKPITLEKFSASDKPVTLQKFSASPPKAIPDHFIVLMKEDKVPPAITGQAAPTDRGAKVNLIRRRSTEVAAKIDSHITRTKINKAAVGHVFSDVVSGYSAKLSANEIASLKKDPDVAGVFQDFEVSLGPVPVSTVAPTDFTPSSSYVTCAIQKAGGPVNSSGKLTWIWILDTGINGNHPDLNVRADYARSFIAGQAWEDGHGHGTHCAGIAAAKMNNIGPTGVSAGATVVPVKVLSNAGSGSFSGIIAGLNYVAANDIPGDVVSMSIGSYPWNNCILAMLPINLAIYNLAQYGTWVVMAAGNDGDCFGASKNMPGCINAALAGFPPLWRPMPRAVTVGALECNLVKAPYSNLGSPTDWVAVGSNVWSTYKNQGYATMSGTSMATPVVAGIIHARNGNPPVNGGMIPTPCGSAYPLAHR